MIVTLVLAGLGFIVWTVRLEWLIRRGGRVDPVASTDDVSVIVPARDEEANLPALLGSLAALRPPPGEVVIVDDHSRDATAAIAQAAGATVLTPPPLPDHTIGKPWACKAGSAAARGEVLLFSDADTVHAPDSLARTVGRLRATGADLVSVVPTHVVVSWWERLQGAFQLLLLIASGRRFAIGQYLLFRRDAYRRLGGHDPFLDLVAEDLAMARAVRDAGGRYELVFAPGLMKVRMYDSLRAFVRGWRRNMRAGIGEAGPVSFLEIVLVIAWLAGLPLALVSALIAGEPALILAIAWGLTLVEVARRQRALVGPLPWWSAALAPLALVVFTLCTVLALWDHARGAPVHWRGRAVRAPRWRRRSIAR